MEIFKWIGIGLIATMAAAVIKPQRAELALPVSILAGVLILLGLAGELSQVVEVFGSLSEYLGPQQEAVAVVGKVIGIAYAAEFACNVCRDAGESSIATKIELAGKVLIFLLCAPLIRSLLAMISTMM